MRGFRYGFGFVPNYTGVLSGGIPVDTPNALPAGLPFSLGGTAPPITIFDVNSATMDGTARGLKCEQGIFDTEADDFSITMSFKIDSYGSSYRVLLAKIDSPNDEFFALVNNGNLAVVFYSDAGAQVAQLDSGAGSILEDTLYTMTINKTGTTATLWLDGIQKDSETLPSGLGYLDAIYIGENPSDSGSRLDGAFSFITVAEDFTPSEIAYMHEKNRCYDNLESAIKTKIINGGEYWYTGNFNGNEGQELVGQANGIDLTPLGSPTYTDQGLQVEC